MNKRVFFNFIIPLVLACVITCLFQVVHVRADYTIPSEYVQIVYNQDNGLGSTEVNCVYQTKSGYIWVGTDGGLYRYGGKEFKIYNLWDTEKADVYFINNLFQDSRGRLWVATGNYGLFYIKGNDIVHFSSEYYNGVKTINDVCEGENGTIYVATAYGVYTVDEDNMRLVRDENLAKHSVKGLTLANGKVYGIYSGNKIFSLDEEGSFMSVGTSKVTDFELTTIASDVNGNIYVGTIGSDVLTFTSFDKISTLHTGREGINRIYPNRGRIYICTDNGAGYLNKDHDYISIYGMKVDDYITSMIVDYEGNLWFSSSRNGLLFMGRGKFADFNNRFSLPESSANCITIRDDMKYIGTDDGLVVLDAKNKPVEDEKIKNLIDYLGTNSIRDIMCDSKGNLWITVYRRLGIVKFSPKGKIKNYDRFDGLRTNVVNITYELSDGRIAVATEEGISIIETDDTISEGYGYEQGMESPSIISMYQDENGVLYAGSDGGGLYLIDGDNIENITADDGLSSNVISAIVPGTNGIWFGTDNGLSYYDETYRGISNIDFSNNIYDIINSGDKLWIIGSKGLIGTTEDELLGTSGLSERYFSSGDGLSKRINIYSDNAIDDDGILYLCCNSGIMTFNTNNVFSNETAPKLNLSEVDVDGKLYYYDQIGGELTVPADTQRISLSFSVLSYTNRENISVTYKLNGFDNTDVVMSGNDNLQAVYTNLDAGVYTFTATAVNGDGVSAERDITFTITKEPGFFEKLSVRVAIVLLITLIISLVLFNLHKVRSQVVGKNKELESLAQEHETALKSNTAKTDYLANMSNDIKIPVNAMITIANKLIMDSDEDDESKEGLRAIIYTGNEVLEKVDETIQLAQLESGSVVREDEAYSLTTLICDLSDKMMNELSEKPIKFLVDLGENIPDILIGDFDKIKAVLEIILDNACKFTKEGSITLTVDSYKNPGEKVAENVEKLVFSVSDTGIGMSEEMMEHIFEIYYVNESKKKTASERTGINLVIAKKLADIISAEIDVESTPGAGTTFTISLDQTTPDNESNPVLATDRNPDRISREEAEKMWTPDVKALLVDDSDLGREVSLGVISKFEMKCDVASSGISAVDMVMNSDYDIVFMDIAMPVMNGIDAMHEIRELSDEKFKDMPIIGISEDALMKNREELTGEGFNEVIVKPFDVQTLASVLFRFIEKDKVKFRTNDVKQYMTESRYSEGLKKLENNFDVVRTLDRIGGNIEVYNRILATFYEQNKDAVKDLKKRINSDYRGFRSRIHNIRTGCQNMGAADCAEITLRIENAINLGNKTYARDNLDMMLDSLKIVIDCIKEYFDFIEEEKGMSDKEYSEMHKVNTSKKQTETVEETSTVAKLIIDIEELKELEKAVNDMNDADIDKIFDKISEKEYVTDDMEFLEVLGKGVADKDYDQIEELIDTYYSLKGIS
ncbi:MAG: response regulator [Eubacterium sp.]|nr:response regulator [Eubacterium sp.]